MVQKRQHIVHLHSADIWRAAEKQLAYLLEGLHGQGFRQTLFCINGSPMHDYALDHGWSTVSYKKSVGANFGLLWKLVQFCSEKRVDIIHIHDSHSLNAWWMARISGVKISAILHRRADFPVGQGFFSLIKYNHPAIKKIICVSEQVRQVMLPVIKDKNKLEVIYDAVDDDLFHGASPSLSLDKLYPDCDGKYKVATIAALVEHKDIPTFIRMVDFLVNQLGRKDMHFFIVGDGALRNKLKSLVRELNLLSCITFTGFVKEIPSLMKALDVYVFSSSSEAFGSTILEALSAGLPVVATSSGAGKEILHHTEDALIADIGDYKTLAAHVVQILDDQYLRKTLISKGCETARSFSKDKYVGEMTSIYLSCISNMEQ
jgi:glycosyltransferase involved in cell wall biosynthesis